MNEKRVHIYMNDSGQLIAQKLIEKSSNGKKICRWEQCKGGEWEPGTGGVSVPLYHADKLIAIKSPNNYENAVLFIVEGEKDVETMERFGFHATTTPARTWKLKYDQYVCQGEIDIVILSDNDEAEERKAHTIV
jgi:hypothetical protein